MSFSGSVFQMEEAAASLSPSSRYVLFTICDYVLHTDTVDCSF